jgi:Family of unknown function (DUF6230)
MKDPTTGRRAYGRTRWRRFGILLAPAFTAVAVMMYMVATGAIAVSFAISGIPFTLNAANLSGNGFVQYATVDTTTNTDAGALVNGVVKAGTGNPSAVSSIGGADAATVTVLHDGTIADLDQTICVPLPGGVPAYALLVELKAGQSAGSPVSFSTLVADAPLLTATDATFTNIDIGRDAQNAISHYVPASGITGADGLFSQSADSVSIDGLTQVSIGTSASSFTVPGLNLSATFVGSCGL